MSHILRPVRIFVTFAFIALLISLSPNAEAEKNPVWTWSSTSSITNVAISSDSSNISATYAQSVSLWKNNTLSPYDPYNTKTLGDGIRFMEMSGDGKYVLTGEETNKLTLWEEGTKLWDKGGFLAGLYGIDISADGSNITAVDRRNVYFFNKSSSTEVWNENFATQEMAIASISPDGRYVAAGTFDGNVYVFLTSDKDNVWFHSDALDGKITDLEFSGDSSHLIIGTESGRVHVYSSLGGEPVTMFQTDKVSCVSAGANSKFYIYGTEGGMLTLFDGSTGVEIWQKNIGGIVSDCVFNGKGTYVFAGSDNRKIVLANVTSGDEIWRVNAIDAVTGVSLSHRGENLVVGSESGLSVYYEQLLDNQAPVASIDSINPVIALPGETINFTGSAIDMDGSVFNYHWSSSIDGNLSSSDTFTSSNLTMGLHIISFMAQDNDGRWSFPVTREIGVGDFPEVSILSIANCPTLDNCLISLGDTLIVSALASSTTSEGINIEIFEWMSNIDGELSNSLNLTSSDLSLGTHTITFRAKNSVGFWSSYVSVSITVNAVPTVELYSINPNPLVAGEESQITVLGLDADEGDILTYYWSTETVTLFNDNNQALFSSEITDQGEHTVSVYVEDSKGAKSNILDIPISIISQPSVELICDPDIELNEEAFFTASAFKPQGSIVKYEWDFDSPSRVSPDSVDFTGFSFATHSYNSAPEDDDGYLVVIKVTDNDGLIATNYCQIPIVIDGPSAASSSSKEEAGLISQLQTRTGLLGVAILLLGIGGFIFYSYRDSFDTYSPPTTPLPPNSLSNNSTLDSSSGEEKLKKPAKKKVIRKRVVSKGIIETMTVECPECSSQIDIPKVSGSHELKCPNCGLEGEIDI